MIPLGQFISDHSEAGPIVPFPVTHWFTLFQRLKRLYAATVMNLPFFKYFSKIILSIFLIEIIYYKLADFQPLLTCFSTTIFLKFLDLANNKPFTVNS